MNESIIVHTTCGHRDAMASGRVASCTHCTHRRSVTDGIGVDLVVIAHEHGKLLVGRRHRPGPARKQSPRGGGWSAAPLAGRGLVRDVAARSRCSDDIDVDRALGDRVGSARVRPGPGRPIAQAGHRREPPPAIIGARSPRRCGCAHRPRGACGHRALDRGCAVGPVRRLGGSGRIPIACTCQSIESMFCDAIFAITPRSAGGRAVTGGRYDVAPRRRKPGAVFASTRASARPRGALALARGGAARASRRRRHAARAPGRRVAAGVGRPRRRRGAAAPREDGSCGRGRS